MDSPWKRNCEVTDSSNVINVSYDPENRDMRVSFRNPFTQYVYHDVAGMDFGIILSSPSVGSAFARISKDRKWGFDKL